MPNVSYRLRAGSLFVRARNILWPAKQMLRACPPVPRTSQVTHTFKRADGTKLQIRVGLHSGMYRLVLPARLCRGLATSYTAASIDPSVCPSNDCVNVEVLSAGARATSGHTYRPYILRLLVVDMTWHRPGGGCGDWNQNAPLLPVR